MPTIFRIRGLRVVIYPNDHRPDHVHVIGKAVEAVFFLNCPDGPIAPRENYGFSLRALRRIAEELTRRLKELCEAWERIHGG